MKNLRLNDNEVREVARMQQMIDFYEGFICALRMLMLSEKEINYPQFTDTYIDKQMNEIWKWVKEHKGK
jgi:2-hydroxy-3-keto-5-methylthiopentenyl-1-phosphate phosphatase